MVLLNEIPVRKVDIYRNGAWVERTLKITIEEDTRVSIKFDQSNPTPSRPQGKCAFAPVKVVLVKGDAILQDVQTRTVPMADVNNPDLTNLIKQMADLQRKRKIKAIEIDSLDLAIKFEKDYLGYVIQRYDHQRYKDNIMSPYPDKDIEPAVMQEIRVKQAQFRAELTDIEAEIIQLGQEIAEKVPYLHLSPEILASSSLDDKIFRGDVFYSGEIVLTIIPRSIPTQIEARITHGLDQMSWKPLYDWTVSPVMQCSTKCNFFAVVSKRPTEIWENVEVSLYNGQIDAALSLPDLQPLKISFEKDMPNFSQPKIEETIS